MEHLLRGKDGEALACNWLIKKDFQILERNWRSGRNEIDVIASKEKNLHFVEVKTRHSLRFGYPEESVTKRKFRCLQAAATDYTYLRRWHGNIQYDILAILILRDAPIEYLFIEDFYIY